VAVSGGFKDYLFDVLAPLGKIEMSRFFGLGGIKVEGQLIGFVDEEKIYFRTDAETRDAYLSEGGEPFSFYKGKELIVTSYVTIPDRLIDDPEEMVAWARRAREAALKAPSAVKRRQRNARKAERVAGKSTPKKTSKPGPAVKRTATQSKERSKMKSKR
jgi:DNA transformation protein